MTTSPYKSVTAFVLIVGTLTLLFRGLTGISADRSFDLANELAFLASIGVKILLLALLSSVLPWPWKDRAVALFLLVYFIELVPSMIDYYFFSSGTAPAIVRILGMGLAEGLIAGVVVARYYPPVEVTGTFGTAVAQLIWRRSIAAWLWRLAACALIYLTLYLVVGGIAFQFTQPYYTDPSYGLELTLPEGGLALIAKLQPLRALIFIGGLSSLLAGLSLPKRRHGILVGLTLFTLGGLTPLLSGPPNWPPALRIYHTIEIFFQNFPAGYLFAGLLAIEPDDKRNG